MNKKLMLKLINDIEEFTNQNLDHYKNNLEDYYSKLPRQSDITNSDLKIGGEPEYLMEGDLVLLHNWGNNSEVIGVAYLYWDEEGHRWDFNNIAGNWIESSYDRWRQSPKKIGHISQVSDLRGINDVTIDEFTCHTLIDESYEKWDGNWSGFLKKEKKKADKAFIEKRIKRIKRIKSSINKKIKDNKKELAELEKELKELEK